MATYAKFQIQNYADLVSWIKRRLAYPLIQVEVDDDMIKQCIDDALEVFTEFVTYDEDYLGVELTDYVVGTGVKLDDTVSGIFSLSDEGVAGSVNTLFTVPNQMMNNRSFPMTRSQGGQWVDYEIAQQSLKMTRTMLGGGYRWNFNERTKMLKLLPEPVTDGEKSNWVVTGVYVVRPEDQIYGERLVKKLALAYVKQILGAVRGTFQNVPLFAGANINEGIGEKGEEEELAVMEEIQNMMPPAFIVGV